ncbi:MAG: cytochrome c oxidase assembly protein [Steroidobacteraceae bacterium]
MRFLPWQFSPTVVIAIALAALLYRRDSHPARPPVPVPAARRVAFYLALLVIYCALQTGWDYYASHMIFVLQLQHFALHDLAPVLLAWASPRGALARCLPRALLNPVVAALTYVAALLIWMWPPVTFDVMLSNGLYKMMSWTVFAGALPFWSLVLDPRPHPRARLTPGSRLVMLHLAMLPIVLTGAALALSERNLYPVYAACGRFLPIPAVADQQLGGVVMWVLGATIYAVTFFIVLGRNLEQEEAAFGGRRLADQW